MPEIIEKPFLEPQIAYETKIELLSNIEVESQIIIHCTYTSFFYMEKIRIWPTTYLYAQNSFEKSELVHAEKITFYPEWTVAINEYYTFTLIFKRLSKSCKIFDLVEEIKEGANPFIVRNIIRNNKDIYYLKIQ